MTTAKEILRMIETVDPSDTAKLDEIDARVTNYIHRDWPYREFIQYTRSRDALKNIRPEGWALYGGELVGDFEFKIRRDNPKQWFDSAELPIEELAELHAIIQAIAYERSQKKTRRRAGPVV